VEAGIGRLLASDELSAWPGGPARTAFVIHGGFMLTAWHCVAEVGGESARAILRLRPPEHTRETVDVPVTYHADVRSLDCAILRLDEAALEDGPGGDAAARLRRYLETVSLPLGEEVKPHDLVRVGGHPERNRTRYAAMHIGRVESADELVGAGRAIRSFVDAAAARSAEIPRGMSGGPLIRLGPDGVERVVGVIWAYPADPQGVAALGGAIMCRPIGELRDAFDPVAAALRDSKQARPRPAAPQLSLDVADRYGPKLVKAGVTPPDRWDHARLDDLRAPLSSPSPGADLLAVLAQAARAKAAFAEAGGAALELGRLQMIYQREVGRWPDGQSADALLVNAADADLHARRRGEVLALGVLAQFVVAVAAATGTDPGHSPAILDLVDRLGHQPGDARVAYRRLRSSVAWLLIDLGDEPAPGTSIWPASMRSFFVSGDREVVQQWAADPTEDGLRRALREVLRTVPRSGPMIVDLAVPYALLGAGIEDWPLFEVDGEMLSLSDEYRPRLRWSPRRRNPVLHSRLVERTGRAIWDGDPELLDEAVLADPRTLKQWVREGRAACLLGAGHPAAGTTDPLRVLLREGCGFLIWFPAAVDPARLDRTRAAISPVPAPARRRVIPDRLPFFADGRPVVVWDDPHGRDDFLLPPPAAAETL
jgi:hypothetical protein